jgi:NADPH:quinone reductase-like Zn-dependent oxidoreductase
MVMATTAGDATTTMEAIVRDGYGAPDVLKLERIEKPGVSGDEVLVRVQAASLNAVDWYALTGTPWAGRPSSGLRRPKTGPIGADVAGTVEAVGKDVTQLRPGDEVFGRGAGFAEYVVGEAGKLARKPAGTTFEDAAAVPVAGITALQGLRDHGGLQPGQRVLVNGASGGVGTFAVQIAKALGAHVTAVCSTGNVELARSLGADRVIDYTHEDFTRGDERYDVMFDSAGSRSWRACKRVLEPNATVVLVGGPKKNRLLGPLGHIGAMKIGSLGGDRKAVFFVAKINQEDLALLGEMLVAGTVRSVIDRRYPLSELGDAMRYLGAGHAKGKIVVTVQG